MVPSVLFTILFTFVSSKRRLFFVCTLSNSHIHHRRQSFTAPPFLVSFSVPTHVCNLIAHERPLQFQSTSTNLIHKLQCHLCFNNVSYYTTADPSRLTRSFSRHCFHLKRCHALSPELWRTTPTCLLLQMSFLHTFLPAVCYPKAPSSVFMQHLISWTIHTCLISWIWPSHSGRYIFGSVAGSN